MVIIKDKGVRVRLVIFLRLQSIVIEGRVWRDRCDVHLRLEVNIRIMLRGSEETFSKRKTTCADLMSKLKAWIV
jgi:hypothetical protein